MALPRYRCGAAATGSSAWGHRVPHHTHYHHHHHAVPHTSTLATALAYGFGCSSSLGRPTRLLRQSATTNTTAASNAADSMAASHKAGEAPPVESTISCYDTFLRSQEDVHLLLLEEAHRKHGVWLTVPPQLAPSFPNTGPPAVPAPLYPPKLHARLMALQQAAAEVNRVRGPRDSPTTPTVLADPRCLAYPPTHEPPPFVTTGTRSFWMANSGALEGRSALPSTSTTTSTTPGTAAADAAAAAAATAVMLGGATLPAQTTMVDVAVRAPVDASMLFHCSSCGRAFRRREAAEAHVQQRHDTKSVSGAGGNSSGAAAAPARVVEGAGPGEITGYKAVFSSVPAAPPPHGASATPSPAGTPVMAAAADAAHPSTSPTADGGTTATGLGGDAASAAVEAPSSRDAPPRKTEGSRLSTAYGSTPQVRLPEEDLLDELLASVWDDVAMNRDDIEKAGRGTASTSSPSTAAGVGADSAAAQAKALDSCNGRFFIPSSAFVEGKADNRAEKEAEMAGKPLARATPEGAAPGVKRKPSVLSPTTAIAARRLLLARQSGSGDGSGGDAGSLRAAAPTALELSIAELSRHYPNPFGDSPNAALAEEEKEPVNPFCDLEAEGERERKAAAAAVTDTADTAETAEQRWSTWQQRFAARPYACPLCQQRAMPQLAALLGGVKSAGTAAGSAAASGSAATTTASATDEEAWRMYAAQVPRFRLLDALDDHLASHHGEGDGVDSAVSEEAWQRLYAVEASPAESVAQEMLAVQRACKTTTTSREETTRATLLASPPADEAVGSAGEAATPHTDATTAADTTDADADAAAAAEANSAGEAPHVHVRAAVNIVLLGEVRDVQEGFVGGTRVLQYVLAVHHNDECAGGSSNGAAEEGADEDLIVVRCVGDLVPVALLHQKVQLGSTLFVTGSLRMNRSTDTASRRSHAYPYVQVVPPLGSVRFVK